MFNNNKRSQKNITQSHSSSSEQEDKSSDHGVQHDEDDVSENSSSDSEDHDYGGKDYWVNGSKRFKPIPAASRYYESAKIEVIRKIGMSAIIDNNGGGICLIAAYMHCHSASSDFITAYYLVSMLKKYVINKSQVIMNSEDLLSTMSDYLSLKDEVESGIYQDHRLIAELDEIFGTKTLVLSSTAHDNFTNINPITNKYGIIYHSGGHYESVISTYHLGISNDYEKDVTDDLFNKYVTQHNAHVSRINNSSDEKIVHLRDIMTSDPMEIGADIVAKLQTNLMMRLPNSGRRKNKYIKYRRLEVSDLVNAKIINDIDNLEDLFINYSSMDDPVGTGNSLQDSHNVKRLCNRSRMETQAAILALYHVSIIQKRGDVITRIKNVFKIYNLLSNSPAVNQDLTGAMVFVSTNVTDITTRQSVELGEITASFWFHYKADLRLVPVVTHFVMDSSQALITQKLISKVFTPVFVTMFGIEGRDPGKNSRQNVFSDNFHLKLYSAATYNPIAIRLSRFLQGQAFFSHFKNLGLTMRKTLADSRGIPNKVITKKENPTSKVKSQESNSNVNSKKVNPNSVLSVVAIENSDLNLMGSPVGSYVLMSSIGNKHSDIYKSLEKLLPLYNNQFKNANGVVAVRFMKDLTSIFNDHYDVLSSEFDYLNLTQEDLLDQSDNSDNDDYDERADQNVLDKISEWASLSTELSKDYRLNQIGMFGTGSPLHSGNNYNKYSKGVKSLGSSASTSNRFSMLGDDDTDSDEDSYSNYESSTVAAAPHIKASKETHKQSSAYSTSYFKKLSGNNSNNITCVQSDNVLIRADDENKSSESEDYNQSSDQDSSSAESSDKRDSDSAGKNNRNNPYNIDTSKLLPGVSITSTTIRSSIAKKLDHTDFIKRAKKAMYLSSFFNSSTDNITPEGRKKTDKMLRDEMIRKLFANRYPSISGTPEFEMLTTRHSKGEINIKQLDLKMMMVSHANTQNLLNANGAQGTAEGLKKVMNNDDPMTFRLSHSFNLIRDSLIQSNCYSDFNLSCNFASFVRATDHIKMDDDNNFTIGLESLAFAHLSVSVKEALEKLDSDSVKQCFSEIHDLQIQKVPFLVEFATEDIAAQKVLFTPKYVRVTRYQKILTFMNEGSHISNKAATNAQKSMEDVVLSNALSHVSPIMSNICYLIRSGCSIPSVMTSSSGIREKTLSSYIDSSISVSDPTRKIETDIGRIETDMQVIFNDYKEAYSKDRQLNAKATEKPVITLKSAYFTINLVSSLHVNYKTATDFMRKIKTNEVYKRYNMPAPVSLSRIFIDKISDEENKEVDVMFQHCKQVVGMDYQIDTSHVHSFLQDKFRDEMDKWNLSLFKSANSYFLATQTDGTSPDCDKVIHDIVHEALRLFLGSDSFSDSKVVPDHKVDLNYMGVGLEVAGAFSSKFDVCKKYIAAKKDIIVFDKFACLSKSVSIMLLEFIFQCLSSKDKIIDRYLTDLYNNQLQTCINAQLTEIGSPYNTQSLLTPELLSCVRDEKTMRLAGDLTNEVISQRNQSKRKDFDNPTSLEDKDMIRHVNERNKKLKQLILNNKEYKAHISRVMPNNCSLSTRSIAMTSALSKMEAKLIECNNIRKSSEAGVGPHQETGSGPGVYSYKNMPIDGSVHLTSEKKASRHESLKVGKTPKINGIEVKALQTVSLDMFSNLLRTSFPGLFEIAQVSLKDDIRKGNDFALIMKSLNPRNKYKLLDNNIPMSLCQNIISLIFSYKSIMGDYSRLTLDLMRSEESRINYITEKCSSNNMMVMKQHLSDLSDAYNAEVLKAQNHSESHKEKFDAYVSSIDMMNTKTVGIRKGCYECSAFQRATDSIKASSKEISRRISYLRANGVVMCLGVDKMTKMLKENGEEIDKKDVKLYNEFFSDDLDIGNDLNRQAFPSSGSKRHKLTAIDGDFPVTQRFVDSQAKLRGQHVQDNDVDDSNDINKFAKFMTDSMKVSSSDSMDPAGIIRDVTGDDPDENDNITFEGFDSQGTGPMTESQKLLHSRDVTSVIMDVSSRFMYLSSVSMILSKCVSRSTLRQVMKKVSAILTLYRETDQYVKNDKRSTQHDVSKRYRKDSWRKRQKMKNIKKKAIQKNPLLKDIPDPVRSDDADLVDAKQVSEELKVFIDYSSMTDEERREKTTSAIFSIIMSGIYEHLTRIKTLGFSRPTTVIDEYDWDKQNDCFVTEHIDHDFVLMTNNIKNEKKRRDLLKYCITSHVLADLTMKSHIATLLSTNRNIINECMYTDTKFGVKASIKRFGTPNKKDCGSYFINFIDIKTGRSLKTESWYYHDIIGYSTGHKRFFALICDTFNKDNSGKVAASICDLYGSLLSANIWGPSKVFKVFRYYVQNFLARSKTIGKTFDSLLESISDDGINIKKELSNKVSVMHFLKALSESSVTCGTPMFGLKSTELGAETCLINLCCPHTSGSKKHLARVMAETHDEIKMADDNFEGFLKQFNESVDVLLEVKDFIRAEKKPGSQDFQQFRESMVKKIDAFYDRFDEFCNKTGNRFTFNVLSLASISKNLYSLGDKVNEDLFSCPTLRSLCSVRSSFNQITLGTSIASQNILNCATLYSSFSVLHIGIRILTSHIDIDFSFKMFDKDQLGGDREISIMGAQFRILQCISENVARSLGKLTGIDMLDESNKTKKLCNLFNHSQGNESLFFSADQTRWGPNFNTLTFGLMMLMLSSRTGQTFIPACINLIGEFKVFETSYSPKSIKEQCTHKYSVPGFLGRFHMGQGIFHYNSSLYHSLVSMTVADSISYLISMNNPGDTIQVHSLVTSDDLSMFYQFLHSFSGIRDIIKNDVYSFFDMPEEDRNIPSFFKKLKALLKEELVDASLRRAVGLFGSSYYEDILPETPFSREYKKLIDNVFESVTINESVNAETFIAEVGNLIRELRSKIKKKATSRQIVNYLLMNYTDTYTKYYGIKSSNYKNVISKTSVEFNTFYLFDDGIGDLSVKFINSSFDGRTSGDYLSDLSAALNKYNDLRSSGVSESSSYVTCLITFKEVYDRWKVDISDRYYPSKIIAASGSVEYRFTSTQIYENNSSVLKHKTLSTASESLINSLDTMIQLSEIRRDVYDTIRHQKTRSDALMCHFVPSLKARLYYKSIIDKDYEHIYEKSDIANNMCLSGFPYSQSTMSKEGVKVYLCRPKTCKYKVLQGKAMTIKYVQLITQADFHAKRGSVLSGCFEKIMSVNYESSPNDLLVYNLQRRNPDPIRLSSMLCRPEQLTQVGYAVDRFYRDEVINRGNAGSFQTLTEDIDVAYYERPNIFTSPSKLAHSELSPMSFSPGTFKAGSIYTSAHDFNITDQGIVERAVSNSMGLEYNPFNSEDNLDSIMDFRTTNVVMRKRPAISIPNNYADVSRDVSKYLSRKYRYIRIDGNIKKVLRSDITDGKSGGSNHDGDDENEEGANPNSDSDCASPNGVTDNAPLIYISAAQINSEINADAVSDIDTNDPIPEDGYESDLIEFDINNIDSNDEVLSLDQVFRDCQRDTEYGITEDNLTQNAFSILAPAYMKFGSTKDVSIHDISKLYELCLMSTIRMENEADNYLSLLDFIFKICIELLWEDAAGTKRKFMIEISKTLKITDSSATKIIDYFNTKYTYQDDDDSDEEDMIQVDFSKLRDSSDGESGKGDEAENESNSNQVTGLSIGPFIRVNYHDSLREIVQAIKDDRTVSNNIIDSMFESFKISDKLMCDTETSDMADKFAIRITHDGYKLLTLIEFCKFEQIVLSFFTLMIKNEKYKHVNIDMLKHTMSNIKTKYNTDSVSKISSLIKETLNISDEDEDEDDYWLSDDFSCESSDFDEGSVNVEMNRSQVERVYKSFLKEESSLIPDKARFNPSLNLAFNDMIARVYNISSSTDYFHQMYTDNVDYLYDRYRYHYRESHTVPENTLLISDSIENSSRTEPLTDRVNPIFCYKTRNMTDISGSKNILVVAHAIKNMISSGSLVMVTSKTRESFDKARNQRGSDFGFRNDKLNSIARYFIREVILKDYKVSRPGYMSTEMFDLSLGDFFLTLLKDVSSEMLRDNGYMDVKLINERGDDYEESFKKYLAFVYERFKISDHKLSTQRLDFLFPPCLGDIEFMNLCPKHGDVIDAGGIGGKNHKSVILDPNLDLIYMSLMGMIHGSDFIYDFSRPDTGRNSIISVSKNLYYDIIDNQIVSELLSSNSLNSNTVTFPSYLSLGTVMDIAVSCLEYDLI